MRPLSCGIGRLPLSRMESICRRLFPDEAIFANAMALEDAFLVLGVSAFWTQEKGLDVFAQLAKELPLPFRVVLVGEIDQKTKSLLPQVLFIPPTRDAVALAEIYSAADVFFNPQREEVLGLVNVEALACGTPVVTFPTGGSPECIDRAAGSVLPRPPRKRRERPFSAWNEENFCLKQRIVPSAPSNSINENAWQNTSTSTILSCRGELGMPLFRCNHPGI